MLDEGLFQLPMFAGIERKGTFIFHKTGQPVHGLHIVRFTRTPRLTTRKRLSPGVSEAGKRTYGSGILPLYRPCSGWAGRTWRISGKKWGRSVSYRDSGYCSFSGRKARGVQDRLFHLLQIRRFDQIVEGVAAKGVGHMFRTAGKKNKKRVAVFFPELHGCLDAAGRSHVNIHEDQAIAGCLENL